MNEAKLRGINMNQLRKEAPTHPTQIHARHEHALRAARYWESVREPERPTVAPVTPLKVKDGFTQQQLLIAKKVFGA